MSILSLFSFYFFSFYTVLVIGFMSCLRVQRYAFFLKWQYFFPSVSPLQGSGGGRLCYHGFTPTAIFCRPQSGLSAPTPDPSPGRGRLTRKREGTTGAEKGGDGWREKNYRHQLPTSNPHSLTPNRKIHRVSDALSSPFNISDAGRRVFWVWRSRTMAGRCTGVAGVGAR